MKIKFLKLFSLLLASIMLFSIFTITSSAASVKQVENLKVVSTEEDDINLKWSKVKSATGYQIYIKKADGKWKKVESTDDTYEEIDDLKSATNYSIKVRAYVRKNGKTTYGKFSKVIKTSTDPSKIKTIQSSATSNKKVKLSWSSVKNADKYQIQKYNALDGKWYKVKNVSDTSCVVSANNGERFRIRAYLKYNNKNFYGDFKYITIKNAEIQLNKDIFENEAKSIVLKDSGVKVSNVRDYDVELDRYRGIKVYEIDFEAGRYEYEYIVNAQTGKILYKEKEIN